MTRLPVFLVALLFHGAAQAQPPQTPADAISVLSYLPKDHKTDGSVNYRAELQKAIDAAAAAHRPLVFPPMTYALDETGLRLHDGMTLWMYGAVFRLDANCTKDGQAFLAKDVARLTIHGGEIVGRNDVWPEGVNVRGVHLVGASRDVRLRDMTMRDLSSNGIGVFAAADVPARDVWIVDCVIEHGCNRYGDYTTPRVGPEKGSVREDQGLIAMYHVRDFVVRGCRLEKSRSDGTHFYRCERGQFVQNKVIAAAMGGYFLEGCTDVLASDNVMRDNGSRGVTIERGSVRCSLRGNVVTGSGREGLWAPQCTGLIVVANHFDGNGRKPNGPKAHQVWNSTITINVDVHDKTKAATADYLVADNVIVTAASQTAAIRVDADTSKGIVIRNNVLRGENRRILVEGAAKENVVVRDND